MPSSELSIVFCYVYVLHSLTANRYYIGFTSDLNKRIAEHNRGLGFSTKPFAPWELVYYEAHRNEDDARRREGYLKTTAGKQALSRILRSELLEAKT